MTRKLVNSILAGTLVLSAALLCAPQARADGHGYIDVPGARIQWGHHRHHGWWNNYSGWVPRYDYDRYYRYEPAPLYLREDPRWYGYRDYRRWW